MPRRLTSRRLNDTRYPTALDHRRRLCSRIPLSSRPFTPRAHDLSSRPGPSDESRTPRTPFGATPHTGQEQQQQQQQLDHLVGTQIDRLLSRLCIYRIERKKEEYNQQQKKTMDSWRVAVLGDPAVGKTALAVQVRDPFAASTSPAHVGARSGPIP